MGHHTCIVFSPELCQLPLCGQLCVTVEQVLWFQGEDAVFHLAASQEQDCILTLDRNQCDAHESGGGGSKLVPPHLSPPAPLV